MSEVMKTKHVIFTTEKATGKYLLVILCHFKHCNFPRLHHHRIQLFLYLTKNVAAEAILLTCWPWAAHFSILWLLYSDGMFFNSMSMSTGNPRGTHLCCYEPITGFCLNLEKKKNLFTSYAEFRFTSYFPKKVGRMNKLYANIWPKW